MMKIGFARREHRSHGRLGRHAALLLVLACALGFATHAAVDTESQFGTVSPSSFGARW